MTSAQRRWIPHALFGVVTVASVLAIAGISGVAQQKGEWPAITGGDTSTRYSPLDQINASNFNTLKVAWEWRGDVGPGIDLGDINARGLPIYVDGLLYTTSGPRRTVVAMDPPQERPSGTSRSLLRLVTNTRCAPTTAKE